MVGYTLRQERERQNLSISDIEQGTSIRALYIEAIENGEYDKLPGAIYTKGFIKNYAKFLEIDVDSVVKEFTNDMAELEAEKETEIAASQAEAEENPAPVKKIEPKPEKKSVGYSIQNENRGSSSKLIVAAVILIAALSGVAWSWLSGSEGDVAKVDNPPQQQTQPVATEPSPPAVDPTPVANANPEQPKQTKQPSDKVSVQARFNDRCWALVTVDGAVVQEGVIDGGQTLSWEGKENVTFRLGNAGAVEFFQDGNSIGVLGGVGDVVDKTFTRK